MGSTQAREMAERLELDQALTWHLRANHYPPIPLEMVEVCKDAIVAFNELDYNREIDLPLGTTYRGLTTAPASAIVDAHHLDAWIETEED